MSLDPDRPFLISPPTGTWFRHHRAYSVIGSFTRYARPGRLGRIVRTVRPVPSDAGPAWVNKIGLRNPGIASLERMKPGGSNGPKYEIVSLAPLEPSDWHVFEAYLDAIYGVAIELNVSCPNVDEHPDLPEATTIKRLLGACPDAIWKLPPNRHAAHTAHLLCGLGARYVHLSNTIPSPIGGISGAPLRELNLPLVESAAEMINRDAFDAEVIAGGGIYAKEHVRAYRDAGATRFSMTTAWFWPPRARRALKEEE